MNNYINGFKASPARLRYSSVVGLAALLMLMVAGPTWADHHENPKLPIYNASEKDFSIYKTAHGIYDIAGLMDESVTPEWQYGGIVRFTKKHGPLKDWTYWYTEAAYVISGKGKVSVTTIPFFEVESYEVGSGDFFFIPTGAKVSFEALSDEPFVMFYAAPKQ